MILDVNILLVLGLYFPNTLELSVLGMYAFDDKEGFWLISSVPEFPAPKSRGYFYKQKQTKVGQALLCVSLNKKYHTVIGK